MTQPDTNTSGDKAQICIVRCADCGEELNRSKPVTNHRERMLTILSGPLCTRACPNGCRATERDMNANTTDEWVDA